MKFTKDHEWVSLDGDIATVGISKHAADALGDVVFVEVPEVGKTVSKGDSFAVVESVKAASDVYAPVSGEVVEANDALSTAPETVNSAPEADGWFAKKDKTEGEIPAATSTIKKSTSSVKAPNDCTMLAAWSWLKPASSCMPDAPGISLMPWRVVIMISCKVF